MELVVKKCFGCHSSIENEDVHLFVGSSMVRGVLYGFSRHIHGGIAHDRLKNMNCSDGYAFCGEGCLKKLLSGLADDSMFGRNDD